MNDELAGHLCRRRKRPTKIAITIAAKKNRTDGEGVDQTKKPRVVGGRGALACLVPKSGFEPPRGITLTRPST